MIAWFICPYKRLVGDPQPVRYCAMDDFTIQIETDGGKWSETEVLGNYAVVKVKASDATLNLIAQTAGFFRLPKVNLTDPLSNLNSAELNTIKDRLIAMGYTTQEMNNSLGINIKDRTLGDILNFAATRRRKPRYDAIADQIFVDGIIQSCKLVKDVDKEVV